MCNLKKNYTNELTYKTYRLTDIENELMVIKGEKGKTRSLGLTHIHYAMLCYAKSLQSCPTLCDPMDEGAWLAAVHGVTKSRTRLSDFTFTFHFHALGKGMATYSSVLAWRIPGTGGAWWAAIYGVAESWTRLKRLSSSSSSSSMATLFLVF